VSWIQTLYLVCPVLRCPPIPVGAFEYIPRKPEETVLYQVLAEHLETFLASQQDRERPVPRFVEREFRDYLTCGIPAHGSVIPH
jgi:hypothetical protein